MKNKKVLNIILIILIIINFWAFSQFKENIYNFYNKKYEYLKNFEIKVKLAEKRKEIITLCSYAGFLFYIERLENKKYPYINGIKLLRKATLIAWDKKSIKGLELVKKVWKDKVFGADDSYTAQEIDKIIKKIKKIARASNNFNNLNKNNLNNNEENEEKEKENKIYNPQALLRAEEYARIDGIEQLAERIFGVMITSFTNVKDFQVQKDVVISNLKNAFMRNAKFSEPKIKGNEVRIVVELGKKDIILAWKYLNLKLKKKVSKKEELLFKKSLKNVYKAIGIGIIDE